MHNFTHTVEPYIPFLYGIHVIISFILALVLTIYLKKRFVNNEEMREKDRKRVAEIEDSSLIFRLFFKISLHKNNRIMSFLFLFLFNIAMPLLGYPLSIWVALFLRKVSYKKRVSNTSILNLDEFGFSFLKVERIFGEGSLSDLMTNESAPKAKKLKALSSLAAHISSSNLRIVRETLSSKDDEIRMFGYAILNKAEQSLNAPINQYITQFNDSKDAEEYEEKKRHAYAANKLSFLYWELIYTELVHDSLKVNFLADVTHYLHIARDFYLDEMNQLEKELEESGDKKFENMEEQSSYEEKITEDKDRYQALKELITKLYILKGRVYMSQEKYDEAKVEFTIAQEVHAEKLSNVLPYLAEIYFLTGNYRVVNSILSNADDLKLNATMHPIIEQWRAS